MVADSLTEPLSSAKAKHFSVECDIFLDLFVSDPDALSWVLSATSREHGESWGKVVVTVTVTTSGTGRKSVAGLGDCSLLQHLSHDAK